MCRVRVDHFKGFSKEHVGAIYAELDDHKIHKDALKAADRELAEEEDRVALSLGHAAGEVAAATASDKALRMRAYYAELQAQAAVKREKDAVRKAEDKARQYPTESGILAGFGRSLR